MAKTIAGMLKEKGRKEGYKEILLRQLRHRFGDLPRETIATINRTTSVPQLIQWL